MRIFVLALSALALPAAAQAQCRAIPDAAGNTILSCPGGTSVLHTDPTGTVTGLVNGRQFVGRNIGPGMVAGTLGGQPYAVQGGLAPEPPELLKPPPQQYSPPPVLAPPPVPVPTPLRPPASLPP
jgi:hypothetical protein